MLKNIRIDQTFPIEMMEEVMVMRKRGWAVVYFNTVGVDSGSANHYAVLKRIASMKY